MSGYMGPSYMPCCYNPARFAQNARCVTGVVRGWTKVPASYCFQLQVIPPLYATKAWLEKGECHIHSLSSVVLATVLVGGELNYISCGDLNPGLAEVAVFNA